MTANTSRIWLNWQAFEVAAISSIFTSDISLDKIDSFGKSLKDPSKLIKIVKFVELAQSVFRLPEDNATTLYNILNSLVLDPLNYLLSLQTDEPNTLTGLDVLCYLFAIFVKKKFKSVADSSSFERFPTKQAEEKIHVVQKNFSLSTPLLSARSLINKDQAQKGHADPITRFFVSHLSAFFNIYAPLGFTKAHIQSLSLLIHCGPNFVHRAADFSSFFNLFNGIEKESVEKITSIVRTHLPVSKERLSWSKNDQSPTSPIDYRPLVNRSSIDSSPGQHPVDKPFVISDSHNKNIYKLFSDHPNVFISYTKNFRCYLLGPTQVVYISNCRDSTIFIGGASYVHVEYCSNIKIHAATRLFHLESSQFCQLYLLTNSNPVFTGSCHRNQLAPYNGLYSHIATDLLSAGINLNLNKWKDPKMFGSLMRAAYEIMPPDNFSLFAVPFTFGEQNLVMTPPLPDEYSVELENKKKRLKSLQNSLKIIREKDPALERKILDQLRQYSSKYLEDEGHMQEVNWLYELMNSPSPK